MIDSLLMSLECLVWTWLAILSASIIGIWFWAVTKKK